MQMDELELVVCPSSSSPSPPSRASFSVAGGGFSPLPEFDFSEVPEEWLDGQADGDDGLDKLWNASAAWGADADDGGSGSRSAGSSDLSAGGHPPAPAPFPVKRRGRKPGPRAGGPVISHVEAERQRRDKLNRRFCELRAAVPTVSKMDKASLLADATAYIADLRRRAEQLEEEAKQEQEQQQQAAAAPRRYPSYPFGGGVVGEELLEMALEVRMVGGGRDDSAALRLTTTAGRHTPAHLMGALRALDLPVQNASAARLGGTTVQDAVVDVPNAALRDEDRLRAALLHTLQRSG